MKETEIPRRPHGVARTRESARLVMVVHHSGNPLPCYAGLGVTVSGTMRTLRAAGLHVEVWQSPDVADLAMQIERDHYRAARPITHVLFNTPNFATPQEVGELARERGDINWIVLNHTGLAYLSIDPHGIRKLRELMDLQLATHNVRLAGNNPRFIEAAPEIFGGPALYLPNLYDGSGFAEPPPHRRLEGTLRIGSFGEGRPWKNQLIAAQAAIMMARRLGMPLELFVNADPWGQNRGAAQSRRELFEGTADRIVEVKWEWWPRFRRTIRDMNLLLSPSFDETFCCVCADGLAEGVPSVVTAAMEWLPRAWQADPCDPASVACIGMALLHDRAQAVHIGRGALRDYVRAGLRRWEDYLAG